MSADCAICCMKINFVGFSQSYAVIWLDDDRCFTVTFVHLAG